MNYLDDQLHFLLYSEWLRKSSTIELDYIGTWSKGYTLKGQVYYSNQVGRELLERGWITSDKNEIEISLDKLRKM